MMGRYLLILLAVGLLASIGAFFLYVSILRILEVTILLTALACMFLLGWQAGRTSAGDVTPLSRWFARVSHNLALWQTEARSDS